MNKQDLAKSTGHLARRLYGHIDPVRVVDTKNLWRKTSGTKRTLTLAHGASRAYAFSNEEVGYPILSVYGSRNLTPTAFAEAKKFLAETTLTMTDLVDADGHDIDGVLPDCITLRLVNNRDLVGEYTAVKAELDAEDERIVTEHNARIAESEARFAAQQDEADRKRLDIQAKAERLDELHAWMIWRHERAVQVRDTEKERSHAGTLFFIETGRNPLQHGDETAEFEERLREEVLNRRAEADAAALAANFEKLFKD